MERGMTEKGAGLKVKLLKWGLGEKRLAEKGLNCWHI